MNIRMGTEDRVAQPGCSQSELNTRKQPEQMVQATTHRANHKCLKQGTYPIIDAY